MKSLTSVFIAINLLLCAFLTPSHASTVDVPSTIDFFTPIHMHMASLNPAGTHIAAITAKDEIERVVLIDSQTQQQTVLLDLAEFSDKESSVGELEWLDDNNIALTFIEIRKGNENVVDSKVSRKMLILSLHKDKNIQSDKPITVREIRTKGKLVHPNGNIDNQFLYAKNASYSKVYKVKIDKLHRYKQKLSKLQRIDGGQFKKSNEMARIKGYALRWFFNRQGEVTAVLHTKDKQTLSLSVFNEDKTTDSINDWKLDLSTDEFTKKTLQPIAQGDDPNVYYCLDLAEQLSQTIYKVNFATNEEEVVYQSTAYDILDVELTPDRTQLQMVRVINDGNVELVYVNGDKKEDLLGSNYQNATITNKISQSSDNSKAIYYIASHNSPGRFVLKNNDKVTQVGSFYPKLDNQLNSQLIEGEVEVEGLTIPYLLTLPGNKRNKSSKHPLIVMPHGGPIGVYDNKSFNRANELFAAHGYAVLRVNFRGSGGYSKAFKQAGEKQYGKLMLKDIYQTTLKVSARDDINAQKVCVFGVSYGGYAAAMLTIKHPQTYKCGATFSGVSDLNLQVSGTNSTKKSRKWFKKQVGDPKTDYDVLKQQSPVYLAQNLTQPLMIYHGGKDHIVLPEQAFRLKLMLEKYQKPFEWHFNEEAGHNTGKPKASAQTYDALLTFFDKHL